MYNAGMTSYRDFTYFAKALTALHWGVAALTWAALAILSFAPKETGISTGLGWVISAVLVYIITDDSDEWGHKLQRSVPLTFLYLLFLEGVMVGSVYLSVFHPDLIQYAKWLAVIPAAFVLAGIVRDRR